VHQTKVTGENNAQQPPKVAIKTKINKIIHCTSVYKTLWQLQHRH